MNVETNANGDAERTENQHIDTLEQAAEHGYEFEDDFSRLRAGFSVLVQLEQQVEGDSAHLQLESPRDYLSKSGQNVEKSAFDRQLQKSMGIAASLGIRYGYDDLAEAAIEIGGEDNA